MDAIRKQYGSEYTHERYVQMIEGTLYNVNYENLKSDPQTIVLQNADFQAWRKAAEICGFPLTDDAELDVEKVKAV